MEPLDPLDPRIAGWWRITKWDPQNDDLSADLFPPGAFVEGETHANFLTPKTEVYNLVWSDKEGQDCSLDYPRAATTRVTFAQRSFLCGIRSELIALDSPAPRSLQLTITLTTPIAAVGGSTGNTGTFIAQSVPGPPPQGTPGPDEPLR
jgi:hypothetical protein